jgi:hypothetical protein
MEFFGFLGFAAILLGFFLLLGGQIKDFQESGYRAEGDFGS